MRRVGHKGAHHIAPGNTTASFDAALAHGVDMIEFDVLPDHPHRPETARLVLAHDYTEDLARAHTLDAGLAHLAAEGFAGVELDVDLKLPGYERRVVDALREHDLIERALVSSQYMRSLVAVRALEPRLRVGWSVPRARRDLTRSVVWRAPAWGYVQYLRRHVPGRAREHLRARRIDAVMSHHYLATAALVRAVHEPGGQLYVWTVDEPALIRRLEALGVDGVITNDPRLFDAVTAPA